MLCRRPMHYSLAGVYASPVKPVLTDARVAGSHGPESLLFADIGGES